jgi:hypothetical protein
MEENLHTEQTQELYEEQLTAITGGGFRDKTFALNTKLMNTRLQKGLKVDAMATALRDRIRENAETNKVFEVDRRWTKHL